MTHKGRRVVKPQHNQNDIRLSGHMSCYSHLTFITLWTVGRQRIDVGIQIVLICMKRANYTLRNGTEQNNFMGTQCGINTKV